MSFYVRKSGKSGWIVTNQTYKAGKRSQKSDPPEAYASLGIRKSMTLDEVKARVAQINKEKRLEKKKVVAAVGNLKEMEIIESVYLPKDRAEGFRDWLIENHGIKGRSRKKILSHWRCVQRLIKATQLLPEQYHSNKKKILNHLIKP
jgi:hypothetical protein